MPAWLGYGEDPLPGCILFYLHKAERGLFCSLIGLPWLAQMVRSLLAVQETWVQSLGQEDPLEKEMATHSSILAWKIPWTEEPGRLHSMVSQRVRYD